jgi:anti-anti-sigma factor
MKTFDFKKSECVDYLKSIEDHGRFFIVYLKGDMYTPTIEKNDDKLSAIIEKVDLYRKCILCDFSEVQSTDTATAAVLIKRLSDFRGRGGKKLIFYNIPENLKHILKIAKLQDLFQISETREDAIKELSQC